MTRHDLLIPMRDGTLLHADLHLPRTAPAPAILLRTPYGGYDALSRALAERFVAHSFAFVVQDVRGRGRSEGRFCHFASEGSDGFDTIAWIAVQEWCTGLVGTMGGSYAGYCQWAACRLHPPNLATMISASPLGLLRQEMPYRNGTFPLLNLLKTYQLSNTNRRPQFRSSWASVLGWLPLQTMDERLGIQLGEWRQWVSEPPESPFWRTLSLENMSMPSQLPVLHVTGWADGNLTTTLHLFNRALSASADPRYQRLIVGPWSHSGSRTPRSSVGGVEFGSEAFLDLDTLQIRWFEQWLRDRRDLLSDLPACRIFVLGENRWRSFASWPDRSVTLERFFLSSSGRAAFSPKDGVLLLGTPSENSPPDQCRCDPLDPVPSTASLEEWLAGYGPYQDRNFAYQRRDVSVYTTPPFDRTHLLMGQPRACLYISADRPDVDLFVHLALIRPDGSSMQVSDGALRARYCHGLESQSLLVPGRPESMSIEMKPIAVLIEPGHRLRLDLAGSNFPKYARNLHSGRPLAEETQPLVAEIKIHHDKRFPSWLELPLVS